jgi:perosamine synthetase
MRTPAWEDLIVAPDTDLRGALVAIDRNAQGIVFVCDAQRRLLGAVSDGDARRALVSGRSLDTPVHEVMNRNCVSCAVGASPEDILLCLGQEGIRHVPLVDEDRRVVDIAGTSRLRQIQVASPDLGGNELLYVADCVKSGWVSSQGSYIRDFERLVAEFCGVPHAVAVCNGTVALQLALAALGIGEGDEVIVPDFTFAASAAAVMHAGATPVLVDVDPRTWTIDAAEVGAAITPRTRAIMPVHLYGQPCEMEALTDLARTHRLRIVEDCAEAFGSRYKGSAVGSLGDAGAFSFYGNKTITTGEGGMVLFTDDAVAERARRLRDHGMSTSRRYWHDEVGFNFRMTNMQGALGVAQMERVQQFLDRKRSLSQAYDEGLAGLPGAERRAPVPWAESVCWLYTFLLDDGAGITRDELIDKLYRNGIESRPVFFPLHQMPPFEPLAHGRAYPVSTDLSRRGISIPSAVDLSPDDVAGVVAAIRGILGVRQLVPDSGFTGPRR